MLATRARALAQRLNYTIHFRHASRQKCITTCPADIRTIVGRERCRCLRLPLDSASARVRSTARKIPHRYRLGRCARTARRHRVARRIDSIDGAIRYERAPCTHQRLSSGPRRVARGTVAGTAQPLSADARRRAPLRSGASSNLHAAESGLGRRLGGRARAARHSGTRSPTETARRACVGRIWDARGGGIRAAATRRFGFAANRVCAPTRIANNRLAREGRSIARRCVPCGARRHRLGSRRPCRGLPAIPCALRRGHRHVSRSRCRERRSWAMLHRPHVIDSCFSTRVVARPATSIGPPPARLAWRSRIRTLPRLLPADA